MEASPGATSWCSATTSPASVMITSRRPSWMRSRTWVPISQIGTE